MRPQRGLDHSSSCFNPSVIIRWNREICLRLSPLRLWPGILPWGILKSPKGAVAAKREILKFTRGTGSGTWGADDFPWGICVFPWEKSRSSTHFSPLPKEFYVFPWEKASGTKEISPSAPSNPPIAPENIIIQRDCAGMIPFPDDPPGLFKICLIHCLLGERP